jgi:hypothetical protein
MVKESCSVMRNEEWIALFKTFPESEQPKLVVVLSSGTEIAIEKIFRLEPTFACIRGRLAGTEDTGRLFFAPYAQIAYLKIDRFVKASEIAAIFGETVDEETLARERAEEFGIASEPASEPQPTTPTPSTPTPQPAAAPAPRSGPGPRSGPSQRLDQPPARKVAPGQGGGQQAHPPRWGLSVPGGA